MGEVDWPRRAHQLETELAVARAQSARLAENNDRLVSTLKEARSQIVTLQEAIDKVAAPPLGYGVFLANNDDGTVDISTGGRELRVKVTSSVESSSLRSGQRVLLNDALNVVGAYAFDRTGEVVLLKEVLDGGDRALVVSNVDEERVVHLAETLRAVPLRAGDSVLIEPRTAYAFERIPKSEVEEFVLEEIPEVGYDEIGGLDPQIEQIRNAVELPFRCSSLFQKYELRPPKGVLLYGPPGCGKTLIAKAVASSLAKQMATRLGEEQHTSYFLNIKGPELLNKYVGETERRIRLIFQRAREKATQGAPVVVFFDEMDAIFRTRGSGISSDVESTIVPQLLSEIDGVEALKNVILIGASNREDLIDPAILRPGRLDVKIRVGRPDAVAGALIFAKYFSAALPIHARDLSASGGDAADARGKMIDAVVRLLYTNDQATRFAEVTFQSGKKQDIHFSHVISGAVIRDIMDRAKLRALLRALEYGDPGIGTEDLLQAGLEQISSMEELANVTSPADWSRVSGAGGERIAYARTWGPADYPNSGKELEVNR